jgi:maleylpyruvate isomerase
VTTDLVTTDLSRHLVWMTEGHRFFMAGLAQVSDDELLAPSALPGWTGRHILSHVGYNARAVARLASWAATGVPTPMYSGTTARADEIALGAQWDAQRLRSFVEVEQEALAAALEKLDVEQWATEVVTAQGRLVTAAALPWLRTRELWVHATDLYDVADFSDFPPPLLDELIVDVLRRRRDANGEILQVRPTDRHRTSPFDGPAPPVWIEGRTADLARWLTGRGAANIHTSDDSVLPTLGPWL